MSRSILLLDCSKELFSRLHREGFAVSEGTVGYINGIKKLPSNIYEHDIVIYNPKPVNLRDKPGWMVAPIDKTPEFELLSSNVENFVRMGGIILAFVNDLSPLHPGSEEEAYGWIPEFPGTLSTKDFKIDRPYLFEQIPKLHHNLRDILSSITKVKIPVLKKLKPDNGSFKKYFPGDDVLPIFENRNKDFIGKIIWKGNGQIIFLPEFQSNEEIIGIFLHRVLPLTVGEKSPDILDEVPSVEEDQEATSLELIKSEIVRFEDLRTAGEQNLASAKRRKRLKIEQDEVANRILDYLKTAQHQTQDGLFYYYKIIEAIENKLGGEGPSKRILGCNEEWNLIKKLSNQPSADARHAPQPGESVIKPSDEELRLCLNASKTIIRAYLITLL